MAAVIAQMAKAKRERSERKKIDIDKCVYELKPFDSHFDAKVSLQLETLVQFQKFCIRVIGSMEGYW